MTAPPLLAQLEPLHAQAYGWALHCCGGDAHAAEEALQTAYWRVVEGGANLLLSPPTSCHPPFPQP